ncbi:hypothetical protein VTO42DRAFT_2458 [Malbranchea cinnamomea]
MRPAHRPLPILLSPNNGHDSAHNSMTARQRTPTRQSFPSNPLSNHSGNSKTLRIPVLDSPLPSPGLPAILPRHGKRPSLRWRRRIRRLLFWATVTALILWVCRSLRDRDPRRVDPEPYDAVVGTDSLPAVPGPVLITDNKGHTRWTVYIPPRADFPLPPTEYARICSESTDVAQQLQPDQHRHGYYGRDRYFIDIPDAQRNRLLPPGPLTSGEGNIVGGDIYRSADAASTLPLCDRSLTFLMQTDDAGLGPTLLALWLSYGLAQREGRAFFIDDTNWAYGRYTAYFRPPPVPNCRPPPVTQRVPCPHQARHLLVSAATTSWTFGPSFTEYFEDSSKGKRRGSVERNKPIFDMMRAGYEALFHLTGDDARYLEGRIRSLRAEIDSHDGPETAGMIVGVHIRRGDRHPLEFQYQDSYIPLDTYIRAAEGILASSSSKPQGKILLSSDDPDVYTSPDFTLSSSTTTLHKAQRYISLASKSHLDAEMPPGARNSALDTNVGWEGGFFAPLFWSLGAPPRPRHGDRDGPAPSQYNDNDDETQKQKTNSQSQSSKPADDGGGAEQRALRLRQFVGRAYLLDMAVLGGASDGIVCGVSSASCRMLGVMMGWDAVVAGEKQKQRQRQRELSPGRSWSKGLWETVLKTTTEKKTKVWRNVDGDWGWRGDIYL